MQRLTVRLVSFFRTTFDQNTYMYTKYGNQMNNYLLHFGLIDKTIPIPIQNNLCSFILNRTFSLIPKLFWTGYFFFEKKKLWLDQKWHFNRECRFLTRVQKVSDKPENFHFGSDQKSFCTYRRTRHWLLSCPFMGPKGFWTFLIILVE